MQPFVPGASGNGRRCSVRRAQCLVGDTDLAGASEGNVPGESVPLNGWFKRGCSRTGLPSAEREFQLDSMFVCAESSQETRKLDPGLQNAATVVKQKSAAKVTILL